MSETRIVDIIEFVDKSIRVINLKIRLRMTALQFGIQHSANKPDALQNRGRLRSNRLRRRTLQCSAWASFAGRGALPPFRDALPF